MPEKSSNKASIIIALIAIFLILGGVFLLNQAISKPKTETTAKASSSSSIVRSSSSVAVSSSTSSQAQTASTASSVQTVSSTASTTSTASSVGDVVLKANESVVSVISNDKSDKYTNKLKTEQCAQPQSQYCKVGGTFYLNNVKDSDKQALVVGKRYKMSADYSGPVNTYSLDNVILIAL